jgi:eukaryotic-like serine/threonine-protein kinase
MIALTMLVSIAVGLGISYSLGWFGDKPGSSQSSPIAANTADTQTKASNSQQPEAPKSKNPLEALQGGWKSSSGREYDAVLVGEALEMRIHDVKPFIVQGYAQNEARLLLRVAPGKTDRFLVEDRLRPNAPSGTEYDRTRARLTCLVPFTEIAGKPLEARLENGQLRISMVVIAPDTSHYTFDGKFVTGCRDLLTSTVTPIESDLSRR